MHKRIVNMFPISKLGPHIKHIKNKSFDPKLSGSLDIGAIFGASFLFGSDELIDRKNIMTDGDFL